jgi:hypothetical protein
MLYGRNSRPSEAFFSLIVLSETRIFGKLSKASQYFRGEVVSWQNRWLVASFAAETSLALLFE